MLNHDFVSDGFLALVVAGLLLLCSSLLVVAFAWSGRAPSSLVIRKHPKIRRDLARLGQLIAADFPRA